MNKNLTVFKIVDIYQAENNKNWHRDFFDTRKFDGIIFFTEGEIKYHFRHKDVIAKKGDILFLPGNLPYSGEKVTHSISFFAIDFLCIKNDEFEQIGAPCIISSKNFNSLLSLTPKIKHIWDNHLLGSDFEIKSFVYSVLSEKYKQDEADNAYNETFLPITTSYYLFLSGTPFRAINSGEFIEDQIYNWTYSDEQKAKQWLRNTIVNRILCIQNKDNIKNAFNKAFKFRRAILVSLAFQLGCNNLAKYEDFLSYMAKGDWARAADEMFNFNWATELQDRIKRYSYVIKNNKCKDFCQNYGWN